MYLVKNIVFEKKMKSFKKKEKGTQVKKGYQNLLTETFKKSSASRNFSPLELEHPPDPLLPLKVQQNPFPSLQVHPRHYSSVSIF
jgi:hypothetical protein